MSDYALRPPSPAPEFRSVGFDDIFNALRQGWIDFRRAPLISLFFGGIVAFVGLAMFAVLTAYRQPWMIVPLAIGFPLLGPFLAAGTYEVSRRLDMGEPLIFGEILSFILTRGRREFSWMAFVVLFIFWIWMYQARILLVLFLDMNALSSGGAFLAEVFTTGHGLSMLIFGTVIGGILAFILFASTVISMPLLVERELDVVTAIITSWRVVLSNFLPLILWGGIVAALSFASMIFMFLPMCVVFPVLGYGTWRLYRCAIVSLVASSET